MVFPKSVKFMNSGSEPTSEWLALQKLEHFNARDVGPGAPNSRKQTRHTKSLRGSIGVIVLIGDSLVDIMWVGILSTKSVSGWKLVKRIKPTMSWPRRNVTSEKHTDHGILGKLRASLKLEAPTCA